MNGELASAPPLDDHDPRQQASLCAQEIDWSALEDVPFDPYHLGDAGERGRGAL